MAERHRPDHRPKHVRRLYVAPAFKGMGADIWAEGEFRRRTGGDRTLLWDNVRYDWAQALVKGWNDIADVLDPEQLDLTGEDAMRLMRERDEWLRGRSDS